MTTSNNDVNTKRAARRATGTSGHDPEQGLARQLSELGRDLQAAPGLDALLQGITEAAALEIDGVEHADISLIETAQSPPAPLPKSCPDASTNCRVRSTRGRA